MKEDIIALAEVQLNFAQINLNSAIKAVEVAKEQLRNIEHVLITITAS